MFCHNRSDVTRYLYILYVLRNEGHSEPPAGKPCLGSDSQDRVWRSAMVRPSEVTEKRKRLAEKGEEPELVFKPADRILEH